jgi:hypothetical protein
MGRKRRKGNTNHKMTNKNIIEDLVESEGDEYPVADIRKMMMTMNRLRKNIGK